MKSCVQTRSIKEKTTPKTTINISPIANSTHEMTEVTLRLSDIPPTRPTKTYRTVHAVIVSIHFGSPTRLFVTDMTSNPIMATSYAYNNYVGSTDDEIPNEKILQVMVYPERFVPFMREFEAKRNGVYFARDHARNVLNYGLFVKMQLRMKWYNNTLEGIADTIEILDSTADFRLPFFKNIIQGLPLSYVSSRYFRVEETIPRELVNQWLNEKHQTGGPNFIAPGQRNQFIPSPTPQRQITSPTAHQSPRTPLQNHRLQLSGELPPDDAHQSDYSTLDAASPYIQVESTQIQIQPRKHISVGYIRKLNTVELLDGKVYDLSGIISEVEPTMGQFCTKMLPHSTPVLNPLSILVRANLRHEETIKISLITKDEILAFFGLDEIEEVYIYAKDLHEKLEKVIKGKKIQDFKIMRRAAKLERMTILSWEPIDMKLEKLAK